MNFMKFVICSVPEKISDRLQQRSSNYSKLVIGVSPLLMKRRKMLDNHLQSLSNSAFRRRHLPAKNACKGYHTTNTNSRTYFRTKHKVQKPRLSRTLNSFIKDR